VIYAKEPNAPAGPLPIEQGKPVDQPPAGATQAGDTRQTPADRTPEEVKRKGKTGARDIFLEHPLIFSIIHDWGGIMSKSTARRLWSKEKFASNKDLWDNAPRFKDPRHNRIYNEKRGETPDGIAQAAVLRGMYPEGFDSSDLFNEIQRISDSSIKLAREERARLADEKKDIKAAKKQAAIDAAKQIRQDAAFNDANKKQGRKDEPIAGANIEVGDKLTIKGEPFEATAYDENTNRITIEDGEKFGTQRIDPDQVLFGQHEMSLANPLYGEEPPAPPEVAPKTPLVTAPEVAQQIRKEMGVNETVARKLASSKDDLERWEILQQSLEDRGIDLGGSDAHQNAVEDGLTQSVQRVKEILRETKSTKAALRPAPTEPDAGGTGKAGPPVTPPHLAPVADELNIRLSGINPDGTLDFSGKTPANGITFRVPADATPEQLRARYDEMMAKRQGTPEMRAEAERLRVEREARQAQPREPTEAELKQEEAEAKARQDEAIDREMQETHEDFHPDAEKLKLRADRDEGGFLNPDLFQGALDFGRKIYETGMDFAAWSARMIRNLGEKIMPHLRRLWDSVTGADILPQARERGGAGTGAAGGAKGKKKGPDYIPSDLHLKKLTETIDKSLRDPKRPMKERFRIGFDAIKKKGVVSKDALTAGLQNTRAAWTVLKNGYFKPVERGGEFHEVILDWNLAVQEASYHAAQFARKALKEMKNPLTREAIPNYIQADGDLALLRERFEASKKKKISKGFDPSEAGMSDEELLRSRRSGPSGRWAAGYEQAMNLTKPQVEFAKQVGSYFDATLQDLVNAGILRSGVENYVTQVFDKPNRVTNKLQGDLAVGDLDTNFRFARQRIFDSYFEGEQAGLVPKHKDIAALITLYDTAFNRVMSSRAMVKNLREAKTPDGDPIVAFSGSTRALPPKEEGGEISQAHFIRSRKVPDDAVTKDGRPYKELNHPALKKWMLAVEHPSLVDPATGKLVKNTAYYESDMLVHPDYHRKLEKRLQSSLFRQGKLGRWLNPVFKGGALAKQTKLSLSGFHLAQEGFHAAMHRTNPFNLVQIDFQNPQQRALIRNGLMMSDHHAMEMFQEGMSGGGLVKHLPGIGRMQQWFNQFLFRDYIPRLKMSMALHALERNSARYGYKQTGTTTVKGATPEELFTQKYLETHTGPAPKGMLTANEVAELTANQANAAFGELNYRVMGRSPTTQDLARLATLAPDFLEARARFAGQAMRPYGKEQRAALYIMGASLYVAARALNKALDDNPHWELDKAFSVVHKGREYRLRSVLGDLAELVTDPRRFLYNRLSPVTKTIATVGTGRDYRGIKLDAKGQALDFLSWFMPITVGGTEPATGGQRVLGGMGVTNKPVTTSVNSVYEQAREFRGKSTDPKVKAAAERAYKETYAESDYRKLLLALQEDDKERAIGEIVKLAVEKGKLTKSAGDRRPNPPLIEYFKNLPKMPFTGSVELEKQFIASMDRAQLEQYVDAIKERKNLQTAFFQILPDALAARLREQARISGR
jgi:hypothetical protein